MFNLLLNIGHDLGHYIIYLINELTRLRQENPHLKIIIGPVIWVMTMLKIIVLRSAISATDMRVSVIPNTIRDLGRLLMGCTPNSVYCFNKTGFLIFFIDIYWMWYGLFITLHKRVLAYLYIVLKVVSILMPFYALTPWQRLPFWLLGIGLVSYEICMAWWLIFAWGYGIDWEGPESFYKHWGKHYRYRYATHNRQLTVRWSAYAYVISKGLILCDYFCYMPEVVEARVNNPNLPVFGSITTDFSYFSALTEYDTAANLRYGILFLLALSSLGVYSIILAGWSSNSKYAFIGALRSAAQMISYEVAISLIILPVIILAGSLNLTVITYVQNITLWFLWPLFPVSVLFLVAMLAETNRTPFDLPEAEAELVAGYNVDYSSLPFAMFFLGEYCNMILISTLYCLLFLGGGLNFLGVFTAFTLSLKAAIIWVFFVLVRATLPRYRYDQLMDIGWKVFLPVSGGFLTFVFGVLVYFDALPVTGELPLFF